MWHGRSDPPATDLEMESPFVDGTAAYGRTGAPIEREWEEPAWNEAAWDNRLAGAGEAEADLEEEARTSIPGYTVEETLTSIAGQDAFEAPALDHAGETQLEQFSPFAMDESFASERAGVAAPTYEVEPTYEAPTYEVEPPYAHEEDEAATATIAAVVGRSVDAARSEAEEWGNGTRKETDPAMRTTLVKYWAPLLNAAETQRAIAGRSPWSAAFISWVMRTAGAGSSFKYSTAHRVYVSDGKRARLAGDTSRYWTYRLDETRPEVGDLVCADRAPRPGAACGGTTYDNVNDGTQRATHCDLVVEVRADRIFAIGGNVSDSVKTKELLLDGTGHLAQPASGCRFFAIMKPPGAIVGAGAALPPRYDPAPTAAEPTASTIAQLPAMIANAVRGGGLTVKAGWAIATGNRDESHLANLVFFARNPQVPVGYKIQAHEKQLAQDWVRARDAVRAVLRAVSAPAPGAASTRVAVSTGVSAGVIARIDGLESRIEAAATTTGVSPHLIRGIVAAESGGNPDSGKGTGGYKGLMQASQNASHLDPDVSLREGAAHYLRKRAAMANYFRRALNRSLDALPPDEQVRIVMVAYNAGEGSLSRAIGFAAAAGDLTRWMQPEHYLRSILSYGAYAVSAGALRHCVKLGLLTPDDLAADIARVTGKPVTELRRTHAASGGWDVKMLATTLSPLLLPEVRRLKNDGSVTLAQAEQRAPRSLIAAARSKLRSTPGYLDTVLRYMKHYESRGG